jgi:hypothetical protein
VSDVTSGVTEAQPRKAHRWPYRSLLFAATAMLVFSTIGMPSDTRANSPFTYSAVFCLAALLRTAAARLLRSRGPSWIVWWVLTAASPFWPLPLYALLHAILTPCGLELPSPQGMAEEIRETWPVAACAGLAASIPIFFRLARPRNRP